MLRPRIAHLNLRFLLFLFCLSSHFSVKAFDYVTLSLPGKAFKLVNFQDSSSRQQGLMYKLALPDYDGALFSLDKPQKVRFWMRNTFIPLDILMLDKHYRVVSYYEYVSPLNLSAISSDIKVSYVLELPAGSLFEYDIEQGSVFK
eukprot:COSAG01_NODE_4_length_55812_cov_1344.168109_10_plen_145_part_00